MDPGASGDLSAMGPRGPYTTPSRAMNRPTTLKAFAADRAAMREALSRLRRHSIARLGAKQDGILRNHSVSPNGTLRDTVVFSIIASEWPAVKAHLTYQLGKAR